MAGSTVLGLELAGWGRWFEFSACLPQAREDWALFSSQRSSDHLRERKGLLHRDTDQCSGQGGEGPKLPLDEVSPEVREIVTRANRLSNFLEWLASAEPSIDNPLESDLFPPSP